MLTKEIKKLARTDKKNWAKIQLIEGENLKAKWEGIKQAKKKYIPKK